MVEPGGAMFGTNVVAMVLAGGAGERLRPLTYRRCKPAVPFGGNFRVIDFTLLNCASARVSSIYVLAQYQAETLDRHCRDRWTHVSSARGQHMETLHPKLNGRGGYLGTADAIYQNIDVLRSTHATDVLVLSGDHVYRADYEGLVGTHIKRRADVTILTGEVSATEACSFGVVEKTPDERVTRFVEKPRDPSSYARHGRCAINLGVYCFRAGFLRERLMVDAIHRASSHDFGKDILPAAVGKGAVVACPLETVCPDSHPYWRDVGTVDSFFESHLDLLRPEEGFRLTDPRWSPSSPFRAWLPKRLPARESIGGRVVDGWNLLSRRVEMDRARVVNSVLSTGVKIHGDATVEDCLLFPGAEVGRGARLRRVIVEEGVSVPAHTVIGYGRQRPDLTTTRAGVVVYPGAPTGRPGGRSPDRSHQRWTSSGGARRVASPESSAVTQSRKSS